MSSKAATESTTSGNLVHLLERQKKTYNERFDIFLSHSHLDMSDMVRLYEIIEDLGIKLIDRKFRVYLDEYIDPVTNAALVSSDNATMLQKRITQCDFLVFAFSDNARCSKWMPWELGVFDGVIGRQRICVVPLGGKNSVDLSKFEYLKLYEIVDETQLLDYFDNQYRAAEEKSREYASRSRAEISPKAARVQDGPFSAPFAIWLKGTESWLDWMQNMHRESSRSPTRELGGERLGKVPGLDRHLGITAKDARARFEDDPFNAPFAIWRKGSEFWMDWMQHMQREFSRGPTGEK